ncbi:MAG: RNA-binding protein [bacterium]
MENSKMYVGNLNYSVSESELRDLFAEHGNVESVKIIEGRGFGFVEMSAKEEMDAAMEALNGQDFKGRTLRIDEARPRKDKGNYNRR